MSEDLFKMIEKRRGELEDQLAAALKARDVANNRVKAVRAELDDLPVRKVRRPKCEKTMEPAEAEHYERGKDITGCDV